jgi:hypothetical protein
MKNDNKATTADAAEIEMPSGLFLSIKIRPTHTRDTLIASKAQIKVNLKFEAFECDFSKSVLAI